MAQWQAFQGRLVVTYPTAQAPNNVNITINPMEKSKVSKFSGQRTVSMPSSGFIEMTIDYPPLLESEAAQFTAFLAACFGQGAVFQLPSFLADIVPTGYGSTGYYQLAQNENSFSLDIGKVYGLKALKIREVLANA